MILLKNLKNQKNQLKKEKKAKTLKNAIILLNRRQKGLDAFESEIFLKENEEKDLQVLKIT